MEDILFCSGKSIFEAAVSGAKRGYNRTTNNYAQYSYLLQCQFDELARNVVDTEERNAINTATHNSALSAILPINFICKHYYKAGKRCEEHVRLAVTVKGAHVYFDSTLASYRKLLAESKLNWEKMA